MSSPNPELVVEYMRRINRVFEMANRAQNANRNERPITTNRPENAQYQSHTTDSQY